MFARINDQLKICVKEVLTMHSQSKQVYKQLKRGEKRVQIIYNGSANLGLYPLFKFLFGNSLS